ncbi:hypothetical protein NEMBOFW57_010308 [Staphylotrichum longicolle]|uniref:Aminoglycoside phosphotransferase domain-containing protein n=1 Tax=Staphylotrichum longicolle TaxID=669026 RepID=A0AAD4HV59_9PEZI|nr:hypothetical protein NEMBOFW57_010308 [Staphylotrichum longicolle]
MELAQKWKIFAQMAEIVRRLQSFQLPESITGFGGVTFNDAGQIVRAEMPTVGAGPWDLYQSSFKGRLEVALRTADANPYIKGWQTNNLREQLSSKDDRIVVHAGFNASNLLFDPDSGRITGLVDYDFATIMHPLHEFSSSFDSTGGQFRGWDWENARLWEDALEAVEVKRPRNIKGIDKVANVDTVLQAILPWRVSNADILGLQTEEAILRCRDENEQHLDKLLSRLGF